MKLNAYWKYFKYIMEHKKNVFKSCWKRKLYCHAITHDISKFSMKEFTAYAHYFYINKEDFKEEFDKAWEYHYKNNKHHWEYWLNETGEPQSIDHIYLQQMIADWEGMALKFGDTSQAFYLKNYKRIKLEYNTRLLLELMLNLNDSLACGYGHTLESFANKYDEETYNGYFAFIKDRYHIDSYKLLHKCDYKIYLDENKTVWECKTCSKKKIIG